MFLLFLLIWISLKIVNISCFKNQNIKNIGKQQIILLKVLNNKNKSAKKDEMSILLNAQGNDINGLAKNGHLKCMSVIENKMF